MSGSPRAPVSSRWSRRPTGEVSVPAVLVAEDDALTRAVMVRALRTAGFDVGEASSGAEAWTALAEVETPTVAILDWHMGEPDGLEICRRLHAAGAPVYVILVTSATDTTRMVEALGSCADDFVRKPVSHRELVARVRVGVRTIEAEVHSASPVVEALRRGVEAGAGELAVNSDEAFGRIYLHGGKIAWVQVSPREGRPEPLGVEVGLDADAMREVIRESRDTGRSFADVLVDWGLVEEEVLRQKLCRWFKKKLDQLLSLDNPSCVFLPDARPYHGRIAFDLDELLPRSSQLPADVAPDAQEWLARHLFSHFPGAPEADSSGDGPAHASITATQELAPLLAAERMVDLLDVEAAWCVWVGSLASGAVRILPKTIEFDEAVAHAHMSWVAAQGDRFVDAMISTPDGFTLMAPSPDRRHVVALELRGDGASPGVARVLLRRLVDSLG